MTAQFEEVIVTTDLLDLEHLGPEPGQGLFHFALRGFVFTAGIRLGIRSRQCTAVQFAVGGQREGWQYDKGTGHHVLGQRARQLAAQCLHRESDTLFRNDIPHQAFRSIVVLPRQYHGVFHAGALAQPGFDLAQFDAEAPDLHLIVVTPQVIHGAVGTPARQVAGAVEQGCRIGAERIGDEFLSGQFRTVQVAVRHTVAADVQLARHAHRHRLLVRIQHVDTSVADWMANRDTALAHALDFVSGGEGRGFGRAITVEQMLRCAVFEHTPDHRRIEHVAPHDQVAKLLEHRQQAVGVLMEQPGGHPQHADRLLGQQLGKMFPGQQHVLIDHHHTTTVEQWRPHVQGTGIEGRVRGERHPVLLVEIGVAVVDHQAVDRPVRHQHALRHPGGTGGVHDVGDGFGALHQLQVIGGSVQHHGVQVHPRHTLRCGRSAQGQQDQRPAVLHHELLAFQGRVDVQRHIDRGALEHRQLTDQQINRTLQQDRHALAWFDAKVDQMTGQAIGPTVQFGVGQALPVVHGRRCLGAGLDLRFEQPMDGPVPWKAAGGCVEIHQQLPTFGRWQDRQAVQSRLRGLLQGLHQALQRNVHIGADPLCANLRHGQRGQQEVFTQVVHRQGQWVVGAFFVAQDLDTVPSGQRVVRGDISGAVPVVEQGTEQRHRRDYAAAALGQRQGGVLMAEQAGQSGVGRLHAAAYIPRAHVHPQRQGVDEHAQRTFRTVTALHPAHQHGAEHHVLFAGHPAQHLGPGQMVQARRAHAQLTGLGPQAAAQVAGQLQAGLFDIAAVAAHILHAERQGRLIDVAEHVAEEGFMLFATDAPTSLGHIVAERHRLAQLVGLAQQVGLHLVAHQFQRRVIEGHVVEQQDRHPAPVGLVFCERNAHQRRLLHIEAVMQRVESLAQLPGNIPGTSRQYDLFHRQLRLAPDHLHRLIQALPDHRGAQDVMTIDDTLQCMGKGVQPLGIGDGERGLQHVGIARRRGNMVVENAFLQRRQRVDVLHVARATRHRVHDAVDGVLVQLYQGQHRRRDPRATEQDAVFRYLDFAAVTHRGRQRHQSRLTEQHTHVGAQTDLAHPPDQADRQQRMATEFEEMVVTADALDLEQVLPDLRQGGFDFALGGFVATSDQCIVFRGRQGLAVELAVGGQRQCVEVYVGHRDHVGRQLCLQMSAQRLDVDCFCLGEVSDQAFVAGHVFSGQHHRFLHRIVLGELGFDLAQFDTETTNFHLVVVTAQVFDVAVRQVAAQVAGLVHPGVGRGAERILEEALSGQVITIEITTGDTGTTDVDFPRYAQRYRLLVFIQQVELGVRDRLADVGGKSVFPGHRDPTRISRGFRRTIEVAQAFDRGLFEQRLHQTALERFTGHVHRVHALAQTTGLQQRLERRRHGVDQGDGVLAVLQFQHISDDFDAAA